MSELRPPEESGHEGFDISLLSCIGMTGGHPEMCYVPASDNIKHGDNDNNHWREQVWRKRKRNRVVSAKQ